MPPWVARQWHAWGCSRSVSGDLCRLSHSAVSIRSLRFYAQSTIQDDAKLKRRTANSAVIVPSSVATTRPADLIAHIKPVLRKRVFKDRFAIFFVTPSFATWLLDDRVFLHKALQQSYAHLLDHNESPYARIHALCAVVDRLPASTLIGNIDDMTKERLKRVEDPAVLETGHEGIAYATLRFSDSIPSSSSVIQDRAAISFVGFERPDEDGKHLSDSVRIPLANTVFQTGAPSTMTYSTWEKAKGSSELTLKEKRNISHHGIRMELNAGKQSTALSVPLVPLSRPRQVEASMGNILRRVIGPDGASITASQELEQHVPKYFSARGEPSQATTVWALVMDGEQLTEAQKRTDFLLQQSHSIQTSNGHQSLTEDKLWNNLWKQEPPAWNSLVSVALASGARLHRVLSGGGGWGKKAGLLSLDPVPVVEADAADESNNFDHFDGPGDLSSALQPVAQEGEYVQFFMSPSVSAKSSSFGGGNEDKSVWGLELGTIPSTTDSMLQASPQPEAPTTNEISVFRHTFGALAEGGMVLSRTFKLKANDSFSIIGRTTVDVPFSRFSAASWVPEFSLEEDVDSFRNCLESKIFPYHRDLVRGLYGEAVTPFLGLDVAICDDDDRGTLSPRRITETLMPDVVSAERPLIRFYSMDTPERDEVAYCIDGLRRADRKVARYVQEYREIMHRIRRQNGLRMDLALREKIPGNKFPPSSSGTLMHERLLNSHREVDDLTREFHEPMRGIGVDRQTAPLVIRKVDTGDTRGFIPWLDTNTNESGRRVRAYHRDFERVMDRIKRDNYRTLTNGSAIDSPDPEFLLAALSNVNRKIGTNIDTLQSNGKLNPTNSAIDRRATQLFETTATLKKDLGHMLTRMIFVTPLTLYTNNSAIDLYQTHLRLRWQLTHMIMSRRGEQPTASFRKHLARLRAFDKNLFTDKGYLSKRYIHAKLQSLEKQHHVSRKMMIRERKFVPLKKTRVLVPGVGKAAKRMDKGGVKVRKMDKEYNAVKGLEDMVRGWMAG